MAGYIRQSVADIQAGEDILAAPLNAEFNAIRDTFHGSTGHEHDGTTGNGPKIDLTAAISGVLPVANGGIAAIHKLNATTAPATGDDSGDGYGVGSLWIDTTNDKFYICVDASLGASVWNEYQAKSSNLDEYAAVNPTSAGLDLLDDADASAQRTTLGLAIGTNVQAYDAGLQSISGLTTASDKTIYTTGSDTYATTDLTSFGRLLIDDADASTARATLGVVIGTDVQAYSANLDEYAAVNPTTAGLALLDDADSSAQRTTLGLAIGTNVQAYDAGLASIAGLTTSADKMIYTSGSDTYVVTGLTSFGRSLIDDADASTARTTLGLTIGTNVQAYDAGLASIAGLTTSADKMIYTSGSDTYAVTSLTSFARGLLDDADASTALSTLGVSAQSEATWEAGVGTTEGVVSPAKISAAITALVPDSDETTKGIVELATTSEVTTGTDTSRAVTSAGVAAAISAVTPSSSVFPVGAYGFMRYDSTTPLTNGSTTSGSNVYLAYGTSTLASVSGGGQQQTGTWKNISGVTLDYDGSYYHGYMVRIS